MLCCYAECRYAECRGAPILSLSMELNLEFLLPFREQHELGEPDRPHVGVQVLIDFGAVLKFRKKTRNPSWLERDRRSQDGQTDGRTDGLLRDGQIDR
jgi:hypothetical protein